MLGCEASETRISRSASSASSKVLLKESTRVVGRLLTKPTVSVRRKLSPPGIFTRRVVGSRVAKSLSSASVAPWLKWFSRVDLPLLVVDLLEPLLQLGDFLSDAPLVDFQLGLSLSTVAEAAATLLGELAFPSGQAGTQVAEPGKLDLQLRLLGACSGGEDP